MIKTVRYDTFHKGPHLVVLGAVHGNEKCGTQAISKLIQQLDEEALTLQKGTLTCVPVVNPGAYKSDVRFRERNLNRALYIKETPQLYEDFIDPVLCGVLDQADILIDLHSYESPGGLFGFLGDTSQAEIDLCRHLSVRDFVYGWSDAFANVHQDPRDAMGTVEYARSKGAIATTVECGQHLNKDAAALGYSVLISALAYTGLIDAPVAAPQSQRFVKMRKVFLKERQGELKKQWRHYEAVAQGELLATYDNGVEIKAPEDGFIVLPKLKAPIGGEWFYFGTETACPQPKI